MKKRLQVRIVKKSETKIENDLCRKQNNKMHVNKIHLYQYMYI